MRRTGYIYHLTPGSATDIPQLEMQIAHVEALGRIAAELGAPVIRVFTAYMEGGRTEPAIWDDVVRTLQERMKRGRRCF